MKYIFIATKSDGDIYCVGPSFERVSQIVSEDCANGLVVDALGNRLEPSDVTIEEFPFSE
jgi:hypothetical protein